jgi:hypothetical protein
MRLLAGTLTSSPTRFPLLRYSSTGFGSTIRKQREAGRLGGQNLSERYVRLAKSLKGKGVYLGGFDVPSTTSKESFNYEHTVKPSTGATFHGFVIPDPPAEPSSEGK